MPAKFQNPFAVLTSALLFVNGCMVGPDYVEPEMDVTPEYVNEDVSLYSDAAPEVEWWKVFSDEQLNKLIDRAITENHDVRIAQANVIAARALLGEGRLEAYPIVTAQSSVNRVVASEQRFAPGGRRIQTFYDVTLDAVWELDFFGHVRRSIEALAADYEASIAEQRDALVTVTSEVVRTYFELRGAQSRLEVARRNADNQQKTYDLTQTLFQAGSGTELDIVRARAQLETTLASIPLLEAEIARDIHRLGILVGTNPTELTPELTVAAKLPSLPEQIRIGDPSILLRQRPDIRVAERQLAAVTARVGVATADLFPRISLVGSGGYFANQLKDIGTNLSASAAVGPSLTWAAFDLGRVRARIKATDADAQGRLAAYEQTVLQALEETENTLVNYARNRGRQEHLRIAEEATVKAAELARIRYQNGVDSFLNVLDAESRMLEAQDQLAQSETDTGLALIALYKALGGGWEIMESHPVAAE